MLHRRQTIIGAACGLIVWLALVLLAREDLPAAVLFYLTALAFVIGPGALALIPVENRLSIGDRIALACVAGGMVASLAIVPLEMVHLDRYFAPFAFATTGIAVARWFRADKAGQGGSREWQIQLGLVVVVFAIAAWVSAGRIDVDRNRIALYGDYDTFDLTFYSAISSELTHTVPPASPFYAGHRIVYSYFPLLLLAAVHKFTGVRTIEACVMFCWPFFTSVTAAMAFAFFRRLGSRVFATLSTLLLFTGSGLAYIPGVLRPEWTKYDPVIWSSMFMAPSAEWLYFNTWTPALGVMFAALYAITRVAEAEGVWWMLLAGASAGLLFMFKSFAFGVFLPALVIAGVVARLRHDATARRLLAIPAIAIVCAVPWLMAIVFVNNDEERAAFMVRSLPLVRRMLFKTDLTDLLISWGLVDSGENVWRLLPIATVIFLIGGLGTRCVGILAALRSATGRASMRDWTALAWVVILGVAIPFLLDVAPFPNSIQAYQLALFALWPFTVSAIWPSGAVGSAKRWIATAALIAFSVPAVAHYAWVAHSADAGAPLVNLDAGDLAIIRYLRRTDASSTMMLHSNPLWPSIYAIESERHVVLAWSSYVAGNANPVVMDLRNEIEAFFGSPSKVGTENVDLLRRFKVTHVIERVATDQLNPAVHQYLRLVTGTPSVRLYEVSDRVTQ